MIIDIGADRVAAARPVDQRAEGQDQAAMVQETAREAHQFQDGGSRPTSPLHNLQVQPVPVAVAKGLLMKHHYMHSLPGGTHLAFGVFREGGLLGALTLGVGPLNAYRLVEGARPEDCLVLTRLWLSDELPKNSEPRVLGVVPPSLRRHSRVKFLVSYADPAQGHLGTIYQATGWTYTGPSQVTPLYDLGDGKAQHSRTLSHSFGTHSVRHFTRHGVDVKLVPQAAKHRYVYFLDPTWKERLRVTAAPYPRREAPDGNR